MPDTPNDQSETPPPMVVPLLPSPGVEPPPPRSGIWYVLRGTTLGGLFLAGLGTAGFVTYLRTDKDHKPETVLLWVSVGLIAAGMHFISRQSVRNFIADVGKFLPWGEKGEPPQGPGV